MNKVAKNATADIESQYRSIFENAVEGIYQTTVEGRYLRVNPALWPAATGTIGGRTGWSERVGEWETWDPPRSAPLRGSARHL